MTDVTSKFNLLVTKRKEQLHRTLSFSRRYHIFMKSIVVQSITFLFYVLLRSISLFKNRFGSFSVPDSKDLLSGGALRFLFSLSLHETPGK